MYLVHTAQDLLDSWLHEKKRDDFNLEVQFKDEKWAQRSKPLEHVTRNSVSEDYYDDFVGTSDPLLQSGAWKTLNSSHTSQSPNAMGKLHVFSVDLHSSVVVLINEEKFFMIYQCDKVLHVLVYLKCSTCKEMTIS